MPEELSSNPLKPEEKPVVVDVTNSTAADAAGDYDIPAQEETSQPSGGSKYMLLGVGFVAMLVLAVVAMLVITSGDVAETPPPATLSAEATEGKTLFINNNCGSCHPVDGRAGGTGPRLSTTGRGDVAIKNVIRRGKGAMPGNSRLSDTDLDKMVIYLRAIKPPPSQA